MSNIYEGVWTDHDRGQLLGWVWTVKYRTGIILTTVLAILVTFTANRSWKIWRLLLHCLLDAILPKFGSQQASGIRQQQAVLRNSETAGGALIAFAEILHSGKGNHDRAKAPRIILAAVIIFSLLHWAGFIALGILTTQINTGSIVRSSDSTDCGLWLPSESLPTEVNSFTGPELSSNDTIAAENYVRNCYVTDSASISECNMFLRRSISYVTDTVPCPFRESSVCSATNREAFAMDSGNVSFSDLGINWRHAKQVSIRRRSVCTPLVTEPFLYDNKTIQLYAEQNLHGDIASIEQIRGYSFTVDEHGANVTQFYQRGVPGDYQVSVVSVANGSFAVQALEPQNLSPELTFITLRGRATMFLAPSADPFFYAQMENAITIENNTTVTYLMGRAINTIACQDMIMLCSNITGYCSDWLNPVQLYLSPVYQDKSLGQLWNDTEARSAFYVATTGWLQSTTYYGVLNRGASALQANRYIQSGVQYLISKEQWKLEVENWFRIGLAIMQMKPHRMISTPELDRSRVSNIMNKSEPYNAAACTIVKSRSPKHVTLSMFGIVTVLVFSALLTLVSYLDQILGWLFSGRQWRGLSRWEQSSYLHLLQAAETDGTFTSNFENPVLILCTTADNKDFRNAATLNEHDGK
jgi:hypothetical protein